MEDQYYCENAPQWVDFDNLSIDDYYESTFFDHEHEELKSIDSILQELDVNDRSMEKQISQFHATVCLGSVDNSKYPYKRRLRLSRSVGPKATRKLTPAAKAAATPRMYITLKTNQQDEVENTNETRQDENAEISIMRTPTSCKTRRAKAILNEISGNIIQGDENENKSSIKILATSKAKNDEIDVVACSSKQDFGKKLIQSIRDTRDENKEPEPDKNIQNKPGDSKNPVACKIRQADESKICKKNPLTTIDSQRRLQQSKRTAKASASYQQRLRAANSKRTREEKSVIPKQIIPIRHTLQCKAGRYIKSEKPSPRPAVQRAKKTIPTSPVLRDDKRAQRHQVLSQADRENRQLEEMRKIQVRAPIPKNILKAPALKRVPIKPVTVTRPFKLTEMRKTTQGTSTISQKVAPSINVGNSIRAGFNPQGKRVTCPQPFKMEIRRKELLQKKEQLQSEENKKKGTFHAGPVSAAEFRANPAPIFKPVSVRMTTKQIEQAERTKSNKKNSNVPLDGILPSIGGKPADNRLVPNNKKIIQLIKSRR